MSDYTKIETHAEDAFDNFIWLFRSKGNVPDLLPGDRFQDIENVISDIHDSRDTDKATGISLDYDGQETGILRPLSGDGATDIGYRTLIKAQRFANTSNSIPEDLDSILAILGATSIWIRYVFPAGILLDYSGADILSIDEILNILISATAPIRIEISKSSDTPFGFDGDSTAYGWGVGELGQNVSI